MKLRTVLFAMALPLAAAPAAAHDGPGVGPFGPGLSDAERARLAEERFAAADADGDGQLTQAELVAAAEAAEQMRREERAAHLIERLDADGNGTVSLEEAQALSDPAGRPGPRRHGRGDTHR